jgi:hypothetical protein
MQCSLRHWSGFICVLATPSICLAWGEATALDDSFFYYDICSVGSTTAFVAGSDGYVYKTTNSGSTWTDIYSPIAGEVRSVCFVDANTGWIGVDQYIKYTSNGGSSWSTVLNAGDSSSVWSISAGTTTTWACGWYHPPGAHGWFAIRDESGWQHLETTGVHYSSIHDQGDTATVAFQSNSGQHAISEILWDGEDYGTTSRGPDDADHAFSVDYCYPDNPELGWVCTEDAGLLCSYDYGTHWPEFGDDLSCAAVTGIGVSSYSPKTWLSLDVSRGPIYSITYSSGSWSSVPLDADYVPGVAICDMDCSNSGSTVRVWALNSQGRVFTHSQSLTTNAGPFIRSTPLDVRVSEVEDSSVTVRLYGAREGLASIGVYDISGREIARKEVRMAPESACRVQVPGAATCLSVSTYVGPQRTPGLRPVLPS